MIIPGLLRRLLILDRSSQSEMPIMVYIPAVVEATEHCCPSFCAPISLAYSPMIHECAGSF